MEGFWGNLISGLIILVIGFITERLFGLTEKIIKPKKIVQKASFKPRNTLFVFGWGNNIHQQAEAEQEFKEIGIASGTHALENPKIIASTDVTTDADSKFLLNSLRNLMTTENARVLLEADIKEAAASLNSGGNRWAATKLCSAFGSVIEVMFSRQHNQDATALQRELQKLEQWSTNGNFSEDITAIISKIETILYSYFRTNR